MPAKRPMPRTEGRRPAPLGTAIWLGLATVGGVGSLVSRGRLNWPPTELLADLATVGGCLALIGPILMHRKGSQEHGIGDLVWLAAGMLVWVFDLAAVARGEARGWNWATPLEAQAMGLSVLAVGLAAWRSGVARPTWAWTNVIGWVLGVFWVASAVSSLWPTRALGITGRW